MCAAQYTQQHTYFGPVFSLLLSRYHAGTSCNGYHEYRRNIRIVAPPFGLYLRFIEFSFITVILIWSYPPSFRTWWRHQMETFSALLALCAGIHRSPVTGEFPTERPVTRGFDIFFDLCLNKRASKQSWGWWFETPSRPLWRHCNIYIFVCVCVYRINRPLPDGDFNNVCHLNNEKYLFSCFLK